MKATRIVHGAAIEVACYGAGDDWMLRLSHARLQPQGAVIDAFVPPGGIGFLWARKCAHSWLVSGMMQGANFPRAEDERELMDWALEYFLGISESAHVLVELASGGTREALRASMEE